MSQSNIELNNKMSQIIPKIEYCFGMILVYSIIIFVTLSALFGGVILSPIYAFIFLINKIRNVFETILLPNIISFITLVLNVQRKSSRYFSSILVSNVVIFYF